VSDWDRETLDRQMAEAMAQQEVARDRSTEFEALSAEVVLADSGLTSEEVNGGLVGKSRDGGLDSVHVFINGTLVREDSEYLKDRPKVSRLIASPEIVVHLVQAKESNGFSENAVILAQAGACDLLDLDRDEYLLRAKYSDAVIEATGRFVRAFDALRLTHPSIDIRFSYTSTADSDSVHPNTERALRDFEVAVGSKVYGSTVSARTVGVEAFIAFLKRRPSYDNLLLVVDELLTHEREDGEPSWVTLVSLGKYIQFLTDPADGSYRDYLFADNVRAYDASALVNKEIEKTLLDKSSPEFWWLNNGVTIIGSKVTAPGKRLTIDDVQIVNGLQTSQSIWQVLHDAPSDNPLLKHRVLVRVIPTTDKQVRNQIIRATNSQTPVRDEGLRATSAIQLEVEEFLLEAGYFYDRRRNYYKNLGKPKSRIVGIRQLTQALLTWTKFRPDDARARPNDYLKSDSRHDDLFSRSLPRSTFAWVLEAQGLVEQYLAEQPDLDAAERNDLRFLVAAAVAEEIVGRRNKAAEQLTTAGAPSAVVTKKRIEAAFRKATRALDAAQKSDAKVRRDQLVKNGPFVDSVLSVKRGTAKPKS